MIYSRSLPGDIYFFAAWLLVVAACRFPVPSASSFSCAYWFELEGEEGDYYWAC